MPAEGPKPEGMDVIGFGVFFESLFELADGWLAPLGIALRHMLELCGLSVCHSLCHVCCVTVCTVCAASCVYCVYCVYCVL